MNKCLVTKLNGIVDNASLLKLGEFKFAVTPPSSGAVEIRFGNNVNIHTLNGEKSLSKNSDGSNPTNSTTCINADDKVYVTKNNGNNIDIVVENKYGLNVFYLNNYNSRNFVNADFSDLRFCKNLEEFKLEGANTNLSVDIGFLKNTNLLKVVSCDTNNFVGSISVFKGKTKLVKCAVQSNNLTGDIIAFNGCLNLENLALQGSGIIGNIKNLCESLHNNGKVSGKITFSFHNTNVKLDNDTPYTDTVIATFTSSEVTYQVQS